jgi:uncharacterized protein (DUF2267 family)
MAYGEFLDRVAERAGTGTSQATHDARSVMEVVAEATGGDLIDEVREALDDDLREVLFAGYTGSVF